MIMNLRMDLRFKLYWRYRTVDTIAKDYCTTINCIKYWRLHPTLSLGTASVAMILTLNIIIVLIS